MQNSDNGDNIDRYIWNDENLNEYRKELRERDPTKVEDPWEPIIWSATRKLFFINPTGSLDQNMETISLIMNYMRYMPEETLLSRIFAYDPPIFRVEFMSETEPSSCQFHHRTLDLIEQIIKKRDSGLLRKLYHHIDWSTYTNYKAEIEVLLTEDTATNGI